MTPSNTSPPYRNRRLFADHYLTHRLPELTEWAVDDGASDALAALRALYDEQATALVGANEAQCEHAFIRPILNLLWSEDQPGDCYQVQVSLPSSKAGRRPDYALFRSAADRSAAEPRQGALDYWRDVVAIADAKAFDANLDVKRGDETPAAQIVDYLLHAQVRWGILTNGRLWRLYEISKSREGGVFYEVDLLELLRAGQVDRFRWFWQFFRRKAFAPGPDGRSFVARVFEGSATYATEVSDRLKDSVYDALRLVINGFLDHPDNQLDRHDPATIALVHEQALILLYRLLFVLYAEDRELLPYDRPPYEQYSLYRLHRSVNYDLRHGRRFLSRATTLWAHLGHVFRLIDQGDDEAGIPQYNGGLFSPERYPLLAHSPTAAARPWVLGDRALAEVLDLLAWDRQPGQRYGLRDIDYATLDIRHLGSIYEGLLELQPRLATEPLVEITRGARSAFVPAADAPTAERDARRIEPGEVYLATDRGERKATGSFYTPDFTLAPLLDEAAAAVAQLRPTIDAAIAALATERDGWLDTDRLNAAERAALVDRRIRDERLKLLEPYLSLRVLDPAMGSGHFLVGAADYISFAMATDPNLPEEITGDEPPQLFYKQRVVERCLYGVDLNPLAVELAKLALWLHTVARDKALSFLDHHLRCGDSLVGARLYEDLNTRPPAADPRGVVRRAPGDGQLALAHTVAATLGAKHLHYLLDTFRQIAAAPVGEAEAERHKARLYEQMDRVREPFRQVAALWLAPYFGLPISEEQYGRAVEALAAGFGPGGAFAALAEEPWFAAATDLARQRRFFHWELEFPEAFLSPNGRLPATEAGFDAVIGNPPYVRQEQLGDTKPFFADRYPDVFHGMADLFVYFFGRGLELVRPGRRLAYISSNSWLQTAYAEPLRRHVRTRHTVEELIDLGNNRTFREAPDVCPSIFVIRRRPPAPDHRLACAAFARGEEPTLDSATLAAKLLHVTQADQPDTGWQLTDDATRRLVQKLLDAGRPLGEVVGGRMYYGVKTGLNDAFIIDQATRDRLIAEDPASAEILKPLVRGEDLRPWYQEDEGRWLIRIPAGWTAAEFGGDLAEPAAWAHFRERYPAVAAWLEPFADRARRRQDKGDYWWELRPCVYYDAFEEPKIFWPDIAKIPRFSWDEGGKYGNNTCYMAPFEDPWLVGLLNSRCGWLAISSIAVPLGERLGLLRYRLFDQYLRRVPAPLADSDATKGVSAGARAVAAAASERYALHRAARRRIAADLGSGSGRLNQRLTAWWQLSFAEFRAEARKCFGRDLPVSERDDWERWLATQRAEHDRLTARIVDLETALNDRVYHLYGLTRAEIAIVESVTKYRYGEV